LLDLKGNPAIAVEVSDYEEPLGLQLEYARRLSHFSMKYPSCRCSRELAAMNRSRGCGPGELGFVAREIVYDQ